MIMWYSGLAMGVGRFAIPLRQLGMIAMPDAGLNPTKCVGSVS